MCGALLILLATPLFAQFDRGQISGFVKDPSGAFVPGATITITNEATGTVRTAVSDERGFYIQPGLDVGFYTTTVELTGFK